MKVTLYSTHCPKCNVLSAKLKQKNVSFKEVTDVDVMEELGIKSVPFLRVERQVENFEEVSLMNFKEALDWINSLEKQNEY